jgi:hypothetical protein
MAVITLLSLALRRSCRRMAATVLLTWTLRHAWYLRVALSVTAAVVIGLTRTLRSLSVELTWSNYGEKLVALPLFLVGAAHVAAHTSVAAFADVEVELRALGVPVVAACEV